MLHLNTIDDITHETLVSLQAKDYLKDFALVGGTNLSLRLGYRKSIDPGLFSVVEFNTEKLNDHLQIDFNYDFRSLSKYMLFGYVNNVKTDWIYHPFPLLEPVEIVENIRMFSIPDVSAMKLFAVTKRGSKKNFFDIFKLCQLLGRDQLFHFFSTKYREDKMWMMQMSLVYFEDAEPEEDPEIIEKGLTWEKVKKYLLKTFSPK